MLTISICVATKTLCARWISSSRQLPPQRRKTQVADTTAALNQQMSRGDFFLAALERQRMFWLGQLAATLERILFDDESIAEAKANIRRVRSEYFWERALAPLVEFVADPHHVGDNQGMAATSAMGDRSGARKLVRRTGLRHDIALVAFHLNRPGRFGSGG